MPKLKRLSGQQVINILKNFGFEQTAQKGSHVKLKRSQAGKSQSLTVPNHKELDTGTLRAIFYQACQYIDSELLKKEFYSA